MRDGGFGMITAVLSERGFAEIEKFGMTKMRDFAAGNMRDILLTGILTPDGASQGKRK